MDNQSIVCPHCGKRIQLTEAFTQQIEQRLRKEFSDEARKREKEHEESLREARATFDQKLAVEKASLEKQAKKRAEETLSTELKDLKAQLEEKASQLAAAQKQELGLRKRQRELEEREQALKLEVDRTLDKERVKIREAAAAQIAEEHRLTDHEKDKQMADMRKQIDDLKRKAEQGSQQAQGEVLELELEAVLRDGFRFDVIDPVGKGVRGGDVIQRVRTHTGHECGAILWESKRTKAWSDGWVAKLKDDQREAKADIAVLVSATLPRDVKHVGEVDGVWVCDFASALGLGTAMRSSIVQLAQARSALTGTSEKMRLLYGYLSGSEFRRRIEAIVESFTGMKEDLDAERRAMEKVWAKREKQIMRVVQNTSGMYGDLQGMIGASLPQIKLLELPGEDGAPKAEGSP